MEWEIGDEKKTMRRRLIHYHLFLVTLQGEELEVLYENTN